MQVSGMAINPQLLGLQLGGSALMGAAIGFFAKKVAKVIAIIVGAELVLFKYLESQGIITVDWNRISAGLVGAAEGAQEQAPNLIETFVSTAGIGAGFAGGFYLGFRKA
jgi:uncharacterized membrane protein (Fun14 family)